MRPVGDVYGITDEVTSIVRKFLPLETCVHLHYVRIPVAVGSSGLLSSLLVYPVMALATFLAGCLIGALAATFLTHAEQHSLGSDSIPLSLSDAFAQIQSGWTRPTQVPSVCSVHT